MLFDLAIHDLVDDLGEFGSGANRQSTLALCLMAMGDALLGGPLTLSLELPRNAARNTAEAMLVAAALQSGVAVAG